MLVEEKRMFGKLSKLLAAVFAVLFIVSTVVLAAEETVSGTIQQMNAKDGTLTLLPPRWRTPSAWTGSGPTTSVGFGLSLR